MGLESTLPDGWRGVEAAHFPCPAFAQFGGLLSIDITGKYIHIDGPAGTEIGIIQGIIGVHIGEQAIPFVLEGIADIEAGDILGSEILFSEKGLDLIYGVQQRREDV